ncbi:uncharacterized protein EKO05_0008117 [Ascochyta rabiei]|uniref:uncharacterized protein n=1 Tax=Didymella rabiei TaxID=5454 RepID=UPI0021FC1C80|nr:uncharacterized protein EKO05_0008117 [Ascochyta rabiei]UPX17779.1 hypothetical protein EKO05_0008117 [Ascochyta rabiei]
MSGHSSSRRSSCHNLQTTAAPRTPHEQFLSSLEFVDTDSLPKDEADCTICMLQFCDRDRCRNKAHEEPVCLPCGHVFRSKCSATWFAERDNCPMCRAKMSEKAKGFWF